MTRMTERELTARVAGHPLQYAMIGDVYVADTQFETDDQVRVRAGTYVEADDDLLVRRSMSCPLCREAAPCRVRKAALR